MRFFTLIHVKGAKPSYSSSELIIVQNQIRPYFLCAINLFRSLQSVGIQLCIVTNSKLLLDSFAFEETEIDIIQLEFDLSMPEGTKFYSAHYKIELFRFLSLLPDEYVGLVDCDVVCINKIPRSLQNAISQKLPMYYDITEQMVPTYGIETVISDKEKIDNRASIGLWAGGEFMAGPPAFFGILYQQVDNLKKVYFKISHSLFHEGDEMITSVSIEKMMADGYNIFDAGNLNIIKRFWSINVKHAQLPLAAYKECFLLHLPADKAFLSKISNEDYRKGIFKKYRRHVIIRKPRRIVSKLIEIFKRIN